MLKVQQPFADRKLPEYPEEVETKKPEKEHFFGVLPSSQERSPSPEIRHSFTDETSAIVKRKKKKKKAKKPPLQTPKHVGHQGMKAHPMQSGLLSQSFALAELTDEETDSHSIFLDPLLPKFGIDERDLLKSLLDQSSFCNNTNLFEVFMADFLREWKELEKELNHLVLPLDEKLFAKILKDFASCNVVMKIYFLYLFTYGKEQKKLKVDLCSHYQPDFFQDRQSVNLWLNDYAVKLRETVNSIKKSRQDHEAPSSEAYSKKNSKRHTELKKVRDFKNDKFDQLYLRIQRINQKVRIFCKCLQAPDIFTLLVSHKTSDWSESYMSSENEAEDRLKAIKKFTSFVKDFIQMITKLGFGNYLHPKFMQHLNTVEQMVALNFSKDSIEKFISSHRECSLASFDNRSDHIIAFKKAIRDSSFTFTEFCRERRIETSYKCSEKKFVPLLLHHMISLDLIDKWMSDIFHGIVGFFLEQFDGSDVGICQQLFAYKLCVERVYMTFRLLNGLGELGYSLRPKEPLIQAIHDHVESKISRMRLHFQEMLKKLPLSEIGKGLQRELANPVFRLSNCLLILHPVFCDIFARTKAMYSSDLASDDFEQLLQEVLQIVRIAKENHQINGFEPSEVKSMIKNLLAGQFLFLCVHLMILEDIQKLFSKPNTGKSLYSFTTIQLPADLIDLLSVKGFDEIFLEDNSRAKVQEPSTPLHLTSEKEVLRQVLEGCEESNAVGKPIAPLHLPRDDKFSGSKEEKEEESDGVEEGVHLILDSEEEVARPMEDRCEKVDQLALTAIRPKKTAVSSSLPNLLQQCHPEFKREDILNTKEKRQMESNFQKLSLRYVRTGRHDIYHNLMTSGQVVLPNDLSDRGTRMSILKQIIDSYVIRQDPSK